MLSDTESYDQKTHRAILMPTYHHIFDFKDSTLRWQRLESGTARYGDARLESCGKTGVLLHLAKDKGPQENSAFLSAFNNVIQILQVKQSAFLDVRPSTSDLPLSSRGTSQRKRKYAQGSQDAARLDPACEIDRTSW